MKKPILVVTTHFVKPVETRIDNEFVVRRKADGTLFQHDELIAAAEGADEANAVDELAGLQVDGCALILDERGFGGKYFKVAGDAAFVALR